MPDGGTLRIETETVAERTGSMRTANGGPLRSVRLTVTDSGEGIEPGVYDEATEPFVTTRTGRIGFGLSSVAITVRRLKGSMRIRSDRGGTSVHVSLPVADGARR
jgi:signal transduction histidine kinase